MGGLASFTVPLSFDRLLPFDHVETFTTRLGVRMLPRIGSAGNAEDQTMQVFQTCSG
jgi:hypothetical protein